VEAVEATIPIKSEPNNPEAKSNFEIVFNFKRVAIVSGVPFAYSKG
jgi:hypothetical protein